MKKFCFAVLICMVATAAQLKAQPAFTVEVVGKGAPILFFPGFGCPGDVWKEPVAVLSKQYECHVFTFAGFGGVPAIEKPWLPKIKEQVIDYVKAKKLHNAIIVGHSLGGTLGLWLASTEKQLFKKLIAVDALPCTGALMMPNFKVSDMVYDNPYSRQMLQMDSTAFKASLQQQVGFMMRDKERQEQVINWMMLADRKTYVYGYIDLLKLDLRQDIANIAIPVVVLAATNPDKATVEKTYQQQYAQLPGTVFHYADKAAHFVMFDQPDWFLKKLIDNIQ